MLKEKEVMEVLEISQKTFYNKMNGKTDFTLCELLKLRNHYECGLLELIEEIKKERERRGNKNETIKN